MDKNTEIAQTKVSRLTSVVTSDPRWQVEDEMMCQVFGYTMFGYAFAACRILGLMEMSDIQQLACNQLVGLGIGENYAEGLIADAYSQFDEKDNTSIHNQLIGVGFSHIDSEDLTELVDSIFNNTEIIRQLNTDPI